MLNAGGFFFPIRLIPPWDWQSVHHLLVLVQKYHPTVLQTLWGPRAAGSDDSTSADINNSSSRALHAAHRMFLTVCTIWHQDESRCEVFRFFFHRIIDVWLRELKPVVEEELFTPKKGKFKKFSWFLKTFFGASQEKQCRGFLRKQLTWMAASETFRNLRPAASSYQKSDIV